MKIMHLVRATLMVRQFLVPVIEGQRERGHEVCVCGSDDAHARWLRERGIEVFCHGLRRSLNPLGIIREIKRIKRVLIEQRIEMLVCHTPLGGGIGRLAAWRAGTATVVYFAHGMTCAPGQSLWKWTFWYMVEKRLARLTDAIIVMNDYDELLCTGHRFLKPGGKVLRIPGMGVDLGRFSAEPALQERQALANELDLPIDSTWVLCAAYLIPEKGVFVFREAAQQICARRDDVCFLLAGEGPCFEPLRGMVERDGMTAHFKVLGWRDDMTRLMRAVDVFVLPTYYFEGLPVSILEAMACGKPVVATRHRGCEDTVRDGQTGFLVPIREMEPLAEKIEELAGDKGLRERMGRAGRHRIEEEFALEDCTAKILTALEFAVRE